MLFCAARSNEHKAQLFLVSAAFEKPHHIYLYNIVVEIYIGHFICVILLHIIWYPQTFRSLFFVRYSFVIIIFDDISYYTCVIVFGTIRGKCCFRKKKQQNMRLKTFCWQNLDLLLLQQNETKKKKKKTCQVDIIV